MLLCDVRERMISSVVGFVHEANYMTLTPIVSSPFILPIFPGGIFDVVRLHKGVHGRMGMLKPLPFI